MSDILDKRVEYLVVVKIPMRHVFGTLVCLANGVQVDCEILSSVEQGYAAAERILNFEGDGHNRHSGGADRDDEYREHS